jgi:glutathione synthase/RimK-type ligase-like ATP-grasp enzyme
VATFQGLAGPASGHVAHVLAGNPAWLRWHLAGRGLPTLDTRLVDLGDEDFAVAAAGALGFPVVVRLAAGGQGGVARDTTAFHEHWRRLVELAPDHRAQVVLERSLTGPATRVAVVGGEVVAAEPAGPGRQSGRPPPGDLPGNVRELAVRAVAAIPGCGYGAVHLVTDPGSGAPVIDTVDPSLRGWAGSPNGSGPTVADAVLAYELDGPGDLQAIWE